MPTVQAAGRTLNYEWVGDGRPDRPTLVFLHEGLGSIGQWRDFPAKLAAATQCRALVYDRYGYGQSDVLEEPKRAVRFMHDEALRALPELLANLKIQSAVLVGHSDGASIALIHAGAGHPVLGAAVMAPHVFIEPICISSVKKAAKKFDSSDLPERLGKYHRDPRKTFHGWADVWLDRQFKSWDIREDYLPGVRCPVIAIQGFEDEYGTMAQLDEIGARVAGRCQLVKLHGCGHSPFRDRPDETLAALQSFILGLN